MTEGRLIPDMTTRSFSSSPASLMVAGRFSEAIPHLEECVRAECCEQQDMVHLACAYQQTGKYTEAIVYFERVLADGELTPSDRTALLERLGYCHLSTRDYARAFHALQVAVALSGCSFRAYVGLGLCAAHECRNQEARSLFEKALAMKPDCADAFNNLGVLAWSEYRFQDALDEFKHALEIDPGHRDALSNYLSAAFTLEMFEDAESILRIYESAAPENAELEYQLAYCRFRLGYKKEAGAILRELLTHSPDHEEARALLMSCQVTSNGNMNSGDTEPRNPCPRNSNSV